MTETIKRIKNYAVCYHQITKKRRLTKSYVLWAVLPGVLLLRAPEFTVNITQRLPVYAPLLAAVFAIAYIGDYRQMTKAEADTLSPQEIRLYCIGNFIIAALGIALLCLLAVLLNT